MKRQRLSPVSDSLAAVETGLGMESLQSRLERYGAGRMRALDMAKYITNNEPCNKGAVGRNTEADKLVAKMQSCGSYLLFRHYYKRDEVRLHAAKFCRKHLLCPFCAIRRGAKYVQAYQERLKAVTAQNARLRAFFVTLTVKDGESLLERYNTLRNALKRYQQQRRDAAKGQKAVEYAKAAGGVFSIEVKRGSGSGLWHPHVHMIWLCEDAPDARKLSAEWLELTGDSHIVDVRECYGESITDAFLEVFKYALKFSDMDFSDNWEAFKILSGKRLVDSFGCLKGVDVPDDMTDGDLDNEPYFSLLYRFARDSGYSFVGLENGHGQ